ncbi:hypothetical protein D1007_40592 [Hordeum vulgare]|nr:hypothetical protein D1007_40592 [Hordeum vulgare]
MGPFSDCRPSHSLCAAVATKELASPRSSRKQPHNHLLDQFPLTSARADELSRRAPRRTGGCVLLQESRNAAGRLAQKLPASEHGPRPAPPPPSPDVLRRSSATPCLYGPRRLRPTQTLYGSTPLGPPPGGAEAAGVSPDVLNPLRSYVALAAGHLRHRPQKEKPYGNPEKEALELEARGFHVDLFTDGKLPTDRHYYSPSSTIDPRRDMHPPPMDPEKLKAIIARYSQVGKALLSIAGTVLVIGEATAELLCTANKLQLHSVDDVRAKGKEHADMIKVQLTPLRKWAEDTSQKWHYKGKKVSKEKPVLDRELSRALSAKKPPN